MPLSKADKEFIELTLKPIQQDIAGVKDHLAKINGRVEKHDQVINDAIVERAENRELQKQLTATREMTCPHIDEIEALKDNVKEVKSVKKFLFLSMSSIATIMGIVWILYKLFVEA